METVTVILVLVLAVVISGSVARMLPFPVPLPLVQILMGAAVAMFAEWHVTLQPNLFFLLFLPPLLFLDGWRIPKAGFFRDIGTILELALGLVIFTVVGMGFFIHWMIPAIPLAVSFALAAIVSPTDPIAVTSIASRVPIPKRMMHILEGESLLNDASGLVCMRFAVAAAMTGSFSLLDALGTFIWLAAGGVAIGIGVTSLIMWTKDRISARYGEETGSQILISLLIPFGAYLAAEHMHCSGILAAVSAGITMSFAENSGQALAVTRVRRSAVWDTVQFGANGVIFVLLGEQLPSLFLRAGDIVRESGNHDPLWLIVYVLAISFGLAALRFIWVWASLRFTLFRAARNGSKVINPGWRVVAAMSLAGVRGAITLAGILTLPLVMNDGTLFPARDLAIFLAAGVILTSLIAANLFLPFLLEGVSLPEEPHAQERQDRARVRAAEAAIRAIGAAQNAMAKDADTEAMSSDVASRIMDLYRQRIVALSEPGGETADTFRKASEIERELRLAGLRAERNEIFRLARTRQLDDAEARRLVREIDLAEARYGVS